LTEKSDPERLSVTSMREPEVPTTSNLPDGLLVPTPTFPLPLTEKSVAPAEFWTSKVRAPPVGETTPSRTTAVGVVAVEEPETRRRAVGFVVPIPTLLVDVCKVIASLAPEES
jgi:hypothetical protein